MTYSLTNMTSLGTVNNEDRKKSAQLFQSPLPGKDSDEAIMLDLFGASGTIEISGIYESNTPANVQSFIAELEALIDGVQSVRTYHSDKSNKDYSVLVDDIDWKSEEAAPTKVNYYITMTEGSA